MRTLAWREAFDVVLNWFTSFGYFDDGENRRVLEGVAGFTEIVAFGEDHQPLKPTSRRMLVVARK